MAGGLHVIGALGIGLPNIHHDIWNWPDNFATQQFIYRVESSQNHTIPIIAYNAGYLGRISFYLNSILTPVTHRLIRKLAPDSPSNSLPTIHEAQKAVFSSFLLDDQYFGIYSNSTSQSLSTAMHNAAFKLLGIPHKNSFFLHELIDELFELIKDINFGGASITAPRGRLPYTR
jgi:hypothetical protein